MIKICNEDLIIKSISKMELICFIEEKLNGCCIHYLGGEYDEINISSIEYIETLLSMFGTTMNGRRASMANQLHFYKKVPLFIDFQSNIILFPTEGIKNDQCIWINYGNCKKKVTKNNEKLTSTVSFRDGTSKCCHISYRTMLKQLKRCKKISDWKLQQNKRLRHSRSVFYYNNYEKSIPEVFMDESSACFDRIC